jgi:hypothetical protein
MPDGERWVAGLKKQGPMEYTRLVEMSASLIKALT